MDALKGLGGLDLQIRVTQRLIAAMADLLHCHSINGRRCAVVRLADFCPLRVTRGAGDRQDTQQPPPPPLYYI